MFASRSQDKQIAEAVNDLGFTAEVVADPQRNSVKLEIHGMTCASCVSIIENVVGEWRAHERASARAHTLAG